MPAGLCVYNQWVYADNCADAVDRLLLNFIIVFKFFFTFSDGCRVVISPTEAPVYVSQFIKHFICSEVSKSL